MIKYSPLFYIGDKSKFSKEIIDLIPSNTERIVEIFCGGAGVSLNSEIKSIWLNDLDKNVIEIHKLLVGLVAKNVNLGKYFIDLSNKYSLINEMNLEEKKFLIEKTKKEFPKTYFAKLNKESHTKLRKEFNESQSIDLLFLLKIYSFNRMMRFNSKGKFNVPVGNLILNKKVLKSLNDYEIFVKKTKVKLTNYSFEKIKIDQFNQNDLIYLDPPYLITKNKYDLGWSMNDEIKFWDFVEDLNRNKIKFIISNVELYKGEQNHILTERSKKYNHIIHQTSYINHKDNTKTKEIKEKLIFNYKNGKII